MRTTAFPAKVRPPKPSRVLPRTHLFRRLDRARQEGVVWIMAPPGAGKTVLVSSYLNERRLSSVWYQIDAGDADPATFFHYLALAARRANPRSRRPLPKLTSEYLPGLPVFTRRFFESLSALLKPSCLYVFDNLHELPERSPMLEVLPLGLDALGSATGVIICSRAEPPAALARLLVHRRLSIIDGTDMAMTRTETLGIARLRRVTLTSSALERLHAETRGWAAGLTLLMDDHANRRPGPGAPNSQTGQALFDYFAREIFDTMPSATRDVLLATAFVPKVTAGMAQALSGNPQAQAVLADLTRRNYFIMVHPGQEDTYRYHRLFRTFLRARAKELLTPAEIADIRARAAMLLEQAGEIEAAAALLRDAQDWSALSGLCERTAATLLGQGRAQTLISWIMMLPEPFREQSPWLLYWLAVAQQPLDPARRHFAQAFALFRAKDNARGQFLCWAGIAHCYYLIWDEYGSSDYWLATFDELRERYPDFPLGDIEPHVVSGLVALLVFRQPYHRAIGTWATRLAWLIENTDNPDLRVRISSPLLTYYLWTGDLRSGGMLIDLLRGTSQSPTVSIPDRMIFMLLDAAYSWHVGSFAHCLDVVTEALELSRTSGFCILDGRIGAQGLYARLALEDTRGCIPVLRAAEAMLTPERRLDVSHYHHQASWFHLLTGDSGRAEHHGRKALALANQSGCVFPRALCHLFLGFVQIERGFFHDAGGHIRAGQQLGRAMRSQVLVYTGLLAEAYSALRQGNDDAAGRALQEAFALGRQHHYISAWGAWQRRVMTRLCGFALARGIETDYVASLIRARGFIPEDSSAMLDGWPWPVKLYTFGHFRIEIDGEPLRANGKGQMRPLELLKLLIASGGRMVPEKQLSAILWPHADGDSSHQSFATTLHRLRRLLRHDTAIRLEEGRVSLNPDAVWLDVWAFEHLDDLSRGSDSGSARRRDPAEDLLALYRGEFLAEEDASWVLVPRERLRARFLRQHRHAGERLEHSNQWDTAVEWYQRGMEAEPLAEEICRGLIRCHRKLKHYSAALAAYHRCEQLLLKLLGRPPNAETQRLYRELLKIDA